MEPSEIKSHLPPEHMNILSYNLFNNLKMCTKSCKDMVKTIKIFEIQSVR